MASGDDYEDYCNIWAETVKKTEGESVNCVTFSLVFHVSFIRVTEDDDDDDDDGMFDVDNVTESEIRDRTFRVERDRLISNDDESRETLEGILSELHVPPTSMPYFVGNIQNHAKAMANGKTYHGCNVLRMHVRISVIVGEDHGYESHDDGQEGIPPEAITRLVKVEIDERLRRARPECPICLDGFEERLGEVTSTPCSHIFHRVCILRWLNRRNSCPICLSEI